jgi:hypothetical protein
VQRARLVLQLVPALERGDLVSDGASMCRRAAAGIARLRALT